MFTLWGRRKDSSGPLAKNPYPKGTAAHDWWAGIQRKTAERKLARDKRKLNRRIEEERLIEALKRWGAR